jgi:hypothetical protein
MRDDLLDAQAAVDWAVAQIPLLQEGFLDWQRRNPYRVVQERDPDTGQDIAVTYDQPFPLTFNAWTGAIINSLRSGLDLLAATLATRNRVKPNEGTHFPIFWSEQEMIDPLHEIEGKKWLSQSERASIKALNPYKGGDDTLWPLHRLDILRKHERLLSTAPDVRGRCFGRKSTASRIPFAAEILGSLIKPREKQLDRRCSWARTYTAHVR